MRACLARLLASFSRLSQELFNGRQDAFIGEIDMKNYLMPDDAAALEFVSRFLKASPNVNVTLVKGDCQSGDPYATVIQTACLNENDQNWVEVEMLGLHAQPILVP